MGGVCVRYHKEGSETYVFIQTQVEIADCSPQGPCGQNMLSDYHTLHWQLSLGISFFQCHRINA